MITEDAILNSISVSVSVSGSGSGFRIPAFPYAHVARDFVGVVFHVLLDGARVPITTGTVVVLSPHIRSTSISKSLYLVSFSVVLTEALVLLLLLVVFTLGC